MKARVIAAAATATILSKMPACSTYCMILAVTARSYTTNCYYCCLYDRYYDAANEVNTAT